jgi:hypothetical protein
MAIAFLLGGEIKIVSLAGSMSIACSRSGLVVVTPTWLRENVKQSLDYLKAANEGVKTGKSPKGFALMSDPPGQKRIWWKKMLVAAEDAVKRFQNDLATFAPPGTPFGKNGAYRLTGG